ncbi:MAG TPA: dTMP kinase [Candidatus Acidoferrales bacterium]|nr:dTMP kinase [Candidatus Acidoferrales bacterium]
MLVTFEGPEASGKSTQIELLRRLRPGLYLRDPGSTALGERIREILLHGEDISPEAEMYLFLAARAELVRARVLPALARGEWVVLDRYHDSTIAYQGARGLETWWPPSFPRPDLTVGLMLSPSAAAERLGAGPKDRIESASIEFHERVLAQFERLGRAEPERWLMLDATLPEAELADRIWLRVRQLEETSRSRSLP